MKKWAKFAFVGLGSEGQVICIEIRVGRLDVKLDWQTLCHDFDSCKRIESLERFTSHEV